MERLTIKSSGRKPRAWDWQSCRVSTGKHCFYVNVYTSLRVEPYPPSIGGWPKIKYLINNHRSHMTLLAKYLCSVAGHNHVITPLIILETCCIRDCSQYFTMFNKMTMSVW